VPKSDAVKTGSEICLSRRRVYFASRFSTAPFGYLRSRRRLGVAFLCFLSLAKQRKEVARRGQSRLASSESHIRRSTGETPSPWIPPCRARTGLQASTVLQADSMLSEFPAKPCAGMTPRMHHRRKHPLKAPPTPNATPTPPIPQPTSH
jgi:hypothetical protein